MTYINELAENSTIQWFEKKNLITKYSRDWQTKESYGGIFVGVMDHPTLLQHVGASSFHVLHRLDDTH